MSYQAEKPPAKFKQAIHEFNSQQFFECHETLEELWNAEPRDLRLFYQGILQVGVGLYKIRQRPNYRGALTLLQAGSSRLEQFAPQLFGVNVAALLEDTHRVIAELERLGPENYQNFSPEAIPVIEWQPPV